MSVTYDAAKDEGHIGRDGGPAGWSRVTIRFQHGPLKEHGVNGVFNEDVIELLILRLKGLNKRMPCRENSLAITKLEEGLMWLGMRTANRVAQGVEGTNEPHQS